MWNFGSESKLDRIEAARRAAEAKAMTTVVELSSAAAMTTDRDLKITFVNPAMRGFLQRYAAAFAAERPDFDPDRTVGVNLDSLSRRAAQLRQQLAAAQFPCHIEVAAGERTFDLAVAAIKNEIGELGGFAVEWADVDETKLKRCRQETLDRVQAMVEFKPDGTVISANRAFLDMFGYKIAEVRGKHNDIFIDEKTKKTKEYRELWSGLAKGESRVIKTKTVSKSGGEMWLRAAYNPVFDEAGKPSEILALVSDISESEIRHNERKAKLAALERVQAVVEFKLDGTILSANENFLKLMGYGLAEIVGKHHRIFVDPAYAASAEYRDFWERLKHGEYIAQKFKRFGKGGKEIWIRASYNPIFDLDGNVYKVVKFATDITEMEKNRLAVEKERADRAAEQAHVVAMLAKGFDRLTDGDLTVRISEPFAGEYEHLRRDFDATVERLQATIKAVLAASGAISNGAGEISKASDDLAHRTEQQAASLEETAAALEEITATVKKTAENAQNASNIVSTAKAGAEEGGRVVETAITAMSQIEQSSKQITDIIGVMDEISFQTNLLALNAGVEAARAGDAGKGFAVVASEVRSLAQRSSEAARKIKDLIKTSSEHVGSGVKLVGETGAALKKIVEQVVEINTLVSEMAQAAQQQSTGIEEVNTAVTQMDQVTQQNAAMVEESTAAAKNLAGETTDLDKLIGFFKVGDAVAARRAAPPVKREESRPHAARRPSAPAAEAKATSPATTARRVVGGLPISSEADENDWQEF